MEHIELNDNAAYITICDDNEKLECHVHGKTRDIVTSICLAMRHNKNIEEIIRMSLETYDAANKEFERRMNLN